MAAVPGEDQDTERQTGGTDKAVFPEQKQPVAGKVGVDHWTPVPLRLQTYDLWESLGTVDPADTSSKSGLRSATAVQ